MGDSETVVAGTSAVTEYPNSSYMSVDYNAANSNASAEGVVMATETTAVPTSAMSTDGLYAVSDSSSLGDQNKYSADPSTVTQEAPVASTPDATATVGVADGTGYLGNQENAVSESAHAGVHDSSVNGNGVNDVQNFTSAGHEVNGNAPVDAIGAGSEQPYEGDPTISTEEERLWSIVKTNSFDFNAWTALLEETEKVSEDNILKIRKIYDTFLVEFPLCYGYWKKYADHEARLGSIENVVEVYERAVVAVTYSVDIWLHYCVFAMSTYGDPDTVRRLFERGLAYVGTDYLSYPLWDKYIEYEYSQQEWCHLASIYTRILENPNQQLDRYFSSFKELAGSRPLSELRTAEEAAVVATTSLGASGQEVEGEIHTDDAEQSLKSASAGLTEAEELEKYVGFREETYKKAKEFDSKIIGFETSIRRPYFHVRPLNDSELENWHNYLNFIETEGDFNKVVKLYERCLIACANYSEYWIRYVLCMEASGTIDLANNALARATQVFVKRQPEIHIFAARFKEQHGDSSAARASYQLVHSGISPGLLEAIVKHANMEYRLGQKEDAFSLYEQAIATEKGKEHSQTLPILFVQYARFQHLVAGDVDKAREILDGADEHVKMSKPFLEGLIHLESIQFSQKRLDYIDSLVEKFIIPNSDNPIAPSTTEKEDLSSIYLEFLDLFGDAQSLKRVADRHSKLFLSHSSTSESKKRSADDFLASDKTKLAKSYANVQSPAQSVMGAYPSAQNQWPAGYGVQPQAYAQAPQAQGQQWNPAYAQQQVAYSGYSAYNATYTQPQVPVSAPQSTAYAAYPAPYPAQQTLPQQTYAQPAAVAAPYTPAAQPQAPVSQAWYGSYY